jgi:hypothetical protein
MAKPMERYALWIAVVSLLVAIFGAVVPWYYQYLRVTHHVDVIALKFSYEQENLAVSVAFVNRGNKDEVIADIHAIVSADRTKGSWNSQIHEDDWSSLRVGANSFLVPAGAVVVRRAEITIAPANLPFREEAGPPLSNGPDKVTDVGIHVLYLGREGLEEKTFFFGRVFDRPAPKEWSEQMRGGYVHSRIDPKLLELLR